MKASSARLTGGRRLKRLPSPFFVNRRASVSAVVLLVLTLLGGIIAAQVSRTLLLRRQVENELNYLQAEKLAEAGLLLAQSRLKSDVSWQGENWEIPIGVVDDAHSGAVQISVTQNGWVHVNSIYPLNDERQFQVTRKGKLLP